MKYLAWRAAWMVLDAAYRLAARFAALIDRAADAAQIEMLIALAYRRIKAQQHQAEGEGEA
ncbi:MAG: hypothetical protein M9929_03980 [Burkholderiaceae bacterium]|nr:hypothetical protein [Burkholderiaceae bacterium]